MLKLFLYKPCAAFSWFILFATPSPLRSFFLGTVPSGTVPMAGLRAGAFGRPFHGRHDPDYRWVRKYRLLDFPHPRHAQCHQHPAGHAANRIKPVVMRVLHRSQRSICRCWPVSDHPNLVCSRTPSSGRNKFGHSSSTFTSACPGGNKFSHRPVTFAAIAPFVSLR